jgi:dTDP-4-dehydrorhamnose reductase
VKPILVIGSDGQLAKAFKALLPDAVFLGRGVLDLAYPERVEAALGHYNPAAVINAAAYTQVDNAESEEALAITVNAQSPAAIAIYCSARAIPFVHFSTDYVFDGSGDTPWREDDTPAPLGAYGRSKLAGENAVERIGGKYLIFRTSWVYDALGKNFVNTILRLAAEREELRVINDQFGAPTYAPHLAEAVLRALQHAMSDPHFPSGIYHLCNAGVTTWYAFAVQIVEHARRRGLPVKTKVIHPIRAMEYPLPAPRPHNSRLDCALAHSIFGVSLPAWEEGLIACMEARRETA